MGKHPSLAGLVNRGQQREPASGLRKHHVDIEVFSRLGFDVERGADRSANSVGGDDAIGPMPFSKMRWREPSNY